MANSDLTAKRYSEVGSGGNFFTNLNWYKNSMLVVFKTW